MPNFQEFYLNKAIKEFYFNQRYLISVFRNIRSLNDVKKIMSGFFDLVKWTKK